MLENQIAYHVLLQLPKLAHVSGFNDEFNLSWLVCTCTHILGLVGVMTIHTTFKVSTFHCHTYKIIPNIKQYLVGVWWFCRFARTSYYTDWHDWKCRKNSGTANNITAVLAQWCCSLHEQHSPCTDSIADRSLPKLVCCWLACFQYIAKDISNAFLILNQMYSFASHFVWGLHGGRVACQIFMTSCSMHACLHSLH